MNPLELSIHGTSSAACQSEFLKMHRELRRTPLDALHPPSELLRACLGKDADDFEQKSAKAKGAVEFYCVFNPLPTGPCNCAAKYAAEQREMFLWPRMSFTTRVKALF